MTDVVRTDDGVSHGVGRCLGGAFRLDTSCGLSFASWSYQGVKQGRRNRRKPVAQIPRLTTGDVDCMTCLVRGSRP